MTTDVAKTERKFKPKSLCMRYKILLKIVPLEKNNAVR